MSDRASVLGPVAKCIDMVLKIWESEPPYELKGQFWEISTGVPIGLTCNSFSSVSLHPALVLWISPHRSTDYNQAQPQAQRFIVPD